MLPMTGVRYAFKELLIVLVKISVINENIENRRKLLFRGNFAILCKV